jgi:hypothetical protein
MTIINPYEVTDTTRNLEDQLEGGFGNRLVLGIVWHIIPVLATVAWLLVILFLGTATNENNRTFIGGIHMPWLGGNADEAYSHVLNIAIVSGTAFMIGLTFAIDSLRATSPGIPHWSYLVSWGVIGLAIAMWKVSDLDAMHGERVVTAAFIFVVPAECGSALPLWRSRYGVQSRCRLKACVAFSLSHLFGQIIYERTESGVPNLLLAWPICIAIALAIDWLLREKVNQRE